MKSYWKLLAEIYTDIVLFGLDIPAPEMLFNSPTCSIECLEEIYIYADNSFSELERKLIIRAANELEYFLNGLYKIIIDFSLDIKSNKLIHNHIMIKADLENQKILDWDKKAKEPVLGLCISYSDNLREILIVSERLKNTHSFRTTVIHELGHLIGMSHTPPPSIMHAINSTEILYPTILDAEECAKTYGLKTEHFKYFLS